MSAFSSGPKNAEGGSSHFIPLVLAFGHATGRRDRLPTLLHHDTHTPHHGTDTPHHGTHRHGLPEWQEGGRRARLPKEPGPSPAPPDAGLGCRPKGHIMTQENLLPGVSVLFNVPESGIGAQQRGFRLVLRAPAGSWAGAMAPRNTTAGLHVLTASPRWWPPQAWVRPVDLLPAPLLGAGMPAMSGLSYRFRLVLRWPQATTTGQDYR